MTNAQRFQMQQQMQQMNNAPNGKHLRKCISLHKSLLSDSRLFTENIPHYSTSAATSSATTTTTAAAATSKCTIII